MRAAPALWLIFCLVVFPAPALSAEPPPKTFELSITRSAAPAKQRVLGVQKDDVVRLRVTSEVAGELHIHVELKLAHGVPQDLTFNARATGRYRIEWRAAGVAQQDSSHHGAPVAALEVHPK